MADDSNVRYKGFMRLVWENISGLNPQHARQAKIVRAFLFFMILAVFFVNVKIWTTPLAPFNDTNATDVANVTNATYFNRQHYPSPTVLFYGEQDWWEDMFFYWLLSFLVLLSAFSGLCFQCWPLVVPLAVYIGMFFVFCPLLILAAISKLVHVWKNPEEMGDEWALRVSELVSACNPLLYFIMGVALSRLNRG
ncbi:hypothetical protein M3Y99_00302200 [Aphelenchoides fujianensis]|nr:hypothetical protein M3Y99_00302200 [Aphelenchoides fujianensis]